MYESNNGNNLIADCNSPILNGQNYNSLCYSSLLYRILNLRIIQIMKRTRTLHIYAQFYDETKQQLLGTDNFIRCDARMKPETIIEHFRHKAEHQIAAYNKDPKHYCRNRWHHVQLFKGFCPSRVSKVTDIISIF